MSGLLTVCWLLPRLIVGSLLPWYFLEQPQRILDKYITYATVCNDVLSPWFLAKTMFSPWKSITDKYPKNLLKMGEILQVLTLNMTSRVIGVIVRVPLLIISVAIQVLLFFGFGVYILVWFTYPALLVAALLSYKSLAG